MKSMRHIEREYTAMLNRVGFTEKDRINVYTCVNGHTIKTIDIDPGTSPFKLNCGECKQLATSSFYQDTRPDLQVTHEFYRPDLRYVQKKLRKQPEMLGHVLLGGLLLREKPNQP